VKIGRLGTPGHEIPVVCAYDTNGLERVYDASGVTADISGAFLAGGGIAELRAALAAGILPLLPDAAAYRRGCPIARPGNVVCVGMNYAAHAVESGAEPPTVPVIFLKPSNTVSGPDDAAPIPPLSDRYDWEVELGIVLHSEASYLATREEAMSAIAGYVLANDLSERGYQLPGAGGQWTKGKSLPKSTPLGPWLVPADELNAGNLRLRTWVNGEVRQDSSTADLIFDVATVVHHLSQYMVLEPGDVILTGTPQGVALSGRFPYLQEGDIVELEIDGLGRQRQEYYRTVLSTDATDFVEAS
jgi:2,4-didehydro-3-deoxy-L-rhamnonate hydrolase